jgi:hypothetical protein
MRSQIERSEGPKVTAGIYGFYRVKIVDPVKGKIKGDSKWHHNLITNTITNYLTQVLGASAGSSLLKYVALGSATTSALATAASASLPGEIAKSQMSSFGSTQITTRASSTAGDTLTFLATFTSNQFGASTTIGNLGLYATTSANSYFCWGSFASSTVATNQAVNVTYQIVFIASTS